ncbi:hypothetical protein F5X96DRAFT_619223 [Biscogniauxia mediterranea]|nr:hypothetical protein F5X96DRAFT_619223 [Biscogniauxia mediterranea]
MAANLARLSRSWLLASVPAPTPFRPPYSPHLRNLCRPLTTTSSINSKMTRAGGGRASAHRQRPVEAEANTTFLIPLTLVAPPIWRYPRRPKEFLHMAWLHLMNRVKSAYSTFGIWFMSSEKMLRTWPRFKLNRASALPVAKALHVQMSEALAAGDKETLRQICTAELFKTLGSSIDSRPKGVRSEWELIRYQKTWYYPRIADFRVTYQPLTHGHGMRLIKQAVVSICSVQRLARRLGDVKLEGSERMRELTEHIVLHSEVNPRTFESGPWKIWGNLSEMSYKECLEDLENFTAISATQRPRV